MTWLEPDEPRLIDQVPPWLRAMGRLSLRLALIGVIILTMVIVFYWLQASRFDIESVTAMPERTLLVDREGKELGAIHGSSRRLVTREEIPEHLYRALITREDKNFPKHGGVHFRGIARAALRNLTDREFSQGASTITMQLARNTYQLRAKSLHRKLLEVAVAFRIEANFSKDEIVTAYLNRIYFGSGAYGIGQAAHSYFGKIPSELTVAEASLLVGIIRAPHDFSPRNDLEAAIRERNQVLGKMAQDGAISFQSAKDEQRAPVHLMPARDSKTDAIRCVRRHLNELLDKSDFTSGGLTAVSTIDPELQATSRAGLTDLLTPFPKLQAALVAIEPESGAIRAIVTARDPKSSQFNRAFDTRRQLGPVFQPFLNAFSTERGRLAIPGQPIQTARQLPSAEIVRLAKRVGFTGPFTEGDELARGNLQATPLEAANALTSLAKDGNSPNSYLIEELRDADDQILFQQQHKLTPVLDTFSAETARDILGTSTWSSLNLPKTDLWVLHASESLALAIWIGYDEPEELPATLQQKGENLADLLAMLAKKKTADAVGE